MSQAAGILKATGRAPPWRGRGRRSHRCDRRRAPGRGWLVDRFEPPRVGAGAHLLALSGALALLAWPSPAMAVAGLTLIGGGYGIVSGMTAGAIAQYWHRNAFGRVAGGPTSPGASLRSRCRWSRGGCSTARTLPRAMMLAAAVQLAGARSVAVRPRARRAAWTRLRRPERAGSARVRWRSRCDCDRSAPELAMPTLFPTTIVGSFLAAQMADRPAVAWPAVFAACPRKRNSGESPNPTCSRRGRTRTLLRSARGGRRLGHRLRTRDQARELTPNVSRPPSTVWTSTIRTRIDRSGHPTGPASSAEAPQARGRGRRPAVLKANTRGQARSPCPPLHDVLARRKTTTTRATRRRDGLMPRRSNAEIRACSPRCRRRPDRRTVHAGRPESAGSSAGRHSRRRSTAFPARRSDICFGYAAIIHERPSAIRSCPNCGACRCKQISSRPPDHSTLVLEQRPTSRSWSGLRPFGHDRRNARGGGCAPSVARCPTSTRSVSSSLPTSA